MWVWVWMGESVCREKMHIAYTSILILEYILCPLITFNLIYSFCNYASPDMKEISRRDELVPKVNIIPTFKLALSKIVNYCIH
jgi:hypothetical protein